MKTKNIFRMLLVAAALLMGANNVKAGVAGQIWPANGADNTSDECSISKDVFINAGVSDGTVLRVYCGPITGGGGSFAIRFYANGQNPEFKAGYEATWETQVVTNNQGLINNSYIDLTCSANTATKLTTGGFSATVNGITIKNVAIVDGSSSGGGSTSTTDVVVWTGSVWSGKWGENGSRVFLDNNTFSSLKCDGKDVIRVYGTLGDIGFDDWGNAWFIQFLGGNWQPQGGWDCLNRSSNSTSDFTGYVDFKVTSEVASILKNNTNTNDGKCAILQGHNITFTSIVVNPSSTSSKTTPTLSFGEGAQETYNITYGDSFTGPTATCNISGLEVTYTSSETSVAEVATYTGAVTIKKAGTTVITASTPETDDYEAASASYTLNIAKVNYTLSYSSSTATAVLGQSWTAPTLNNPSGISVTYSSTNTGVATIDQNGNVTLVAAGETTIKANYAGDINHESKEASYVLTVSAPQPAISFSQASYTTTFGETFTAPVPTVTPSGSSVVYTSSNNNVAIVLNNTVIPVGTGAKDASYGETTITATLADNNTITATYTLRVNAPTAPQGATSVGAIWLGEFGDKHEGKGGLQPQFSISQYFSTREAGGSIRFYGKVGPLSNDSYWKLEIVKPDWSNPRLYVDEGNGLASGYIDIPVDDVDLSGIEYIILNGTNITITAIQVIAPDTPATQDVTLAFSQTSATATIGESFTAPTLTATSNGQQVTLSGITYSSSDTSVATVNASTGAVTLVGEGTTTITATFAGNDTYNGTSASYTLTVSEATPSEDDYIDVSTDGNLAYYGYRTYVTTETVDFSRSIGVEGYYTTSYDEESVTFTQIVGTCPRGVALLLKATSGATEYKLLKSTAAATAPTGNKLVAGTGATVSGSQKYVLTYHAPNIVFAEVNIQGAEVDAEHAYLDLNGSNARGRLSIRLNGESTGISTIQNDERNLDGAIYNLRGQRVENPTKGLYIINGKKVVIK